jgi:hypothetical protein
MPQIICQKNKEMITSTGFKVKRLASSIGVIVSPSAAVRSVSGDYLLAFMTSGLACLLASSEDWSPGVEYAIEPSS